MGWCLSGRNTATANLDFAFTRDESGERRCPEKEKQGWRKMGCGLSGIGESGINPQSYHPGRKAAMDYRRRMVPFVLRAEIVLGCDDLLA
jgi:hypothetical protein